MKVYCEANGERRYVRRILTGNLRGKDHLECLREDDRKILKWVFRKSFGSM
jgi:hypothetical protein